MTYAASATPAAASLNGKPLSVVTYSGTWSLNSQTNDPANTTQAINLTFQSVSSTQYSYSGGVASSTSSTLSYPPNTSGTYQNQTFSMVNGPGNSKYSLCVPDPVSSGSYGLASMPSVVYLQ